MAEPVADAKPDDAIEENKLAIDGLAAPEDQKPEANGTTDAAAPPREHRCGACL